MAPPERDDPLELEAADLAAPDPACDADSVGHVWSQSPSELLPCAVFAVINYDL